MLTSPYCKDEPEMLSLSTLMLVHVCDLGDVAWESTEQGHTQAAQEPKHICLIDKLYAINPLRSSALGFSSIGILGHKDSPSQGGKEAPFYMILSYSEVDLCVTEATKDYFGGWLTGSTHCHLLSQ